MLILSIETSCDETAISLIAADGDFPKATYEIMADILWSQVDIHKEYGGVFPAVAKREHAAIITVLLEKLLLKSKLKTTPAPITEKTEKAVKKLLEREPDLANKLLSLHCKYGRLPIDLIAVTNGPGLEPALWVGVNFAKAVAKLWSVPIVPTDHMEGHILSSLFSANKLADIEFPALSLLISGGHTELVLMKSWGWYEKIGQTRDDAVGEAYDKVARLLGLEYPGGPKIAKLAERARQHNFDKWIELPRPMLNSNNFDFSFSGLKTAVRYAIADKPNLNEQEKTALAREFEEAVAEVFKKKITKAINEYGINTLIVGGGVSANQFLKQSIIEHLKAATPQVITFFPDTKLATDNSIMIALAGHANLKKAISGDQIQNIKAVGNQTLN